jgi:hypothetical protein
MSERREPVNELCNYLSVDDDRRIVVHDVAALDRRCN